MRSGFGARQLQHATTIWKNKAANLTNLVALIFPRISICYYQIFLKILKIITI